MSTEDSLSLLIYINQLKMGFIDLSQNFPENYILPQRLQRSEKQPCKYTGLGVAVYSDSIDIFIFQLLQPKIDRHL